MQVKDLIAELSVLDPEMIVAMGSGGSYYNDLVEQPIFQVKGLADFGDEYGSLTDEGGGMASTGKLNYIKHLCFPENP